MAVNKRLIGGAAAGALVPSEHFGVVTYTGDGSSSNKVGDGSFTVLGLPDTSTAFPYLVSEKVYSSGKYYFEINDLANGDTGNMQCMVGIVPTSFRDDMTYPWKTGNGGLFWYQSNGQLYVNGSGSGSFGTFAAGDDVAVAVDFDNNTMTLYKNGSQSGSQISGVPSGTYHMSVSTGYNQYKGKAALKETLMQYSIPSGYEAWGGDIDTSGDWSNYSEYDGVLDFQPDLVWIKERGQSANHRLIDSTRGATKAISSSLTNAEFTDSTGLTSFNTDGFTLGANVDYNNNGGTFVAWCFKANGGTTSSNTDGSITTTVQANTDAGFSILKYNMNLTSGTFTIGHGLNSAPELVIFKTLGTSNSSWVVYPNDSSGILVLDSNGALSSPTYWNSASPTSTVINMGTGWTSNHTYYAGDTIAYAFHSVENFSKIGSYVGNGSTNGPIVETNFEPAYVMIKNTTTADNWVIFDNARNTTNPRTKILQANLIGAESTEVGAVIDFYSNGFQSVGTGGGGGSGQVNKNANTYIYMAFAADPDTEAPTVASSFDIATYTGTGADQSITGLNFSPSFVWLKGRSGTYNHWFYDTVRGANNGLNSNSTAATNTTTGLLSAFDTDGFTLGSNGEVNQSSANYVAWAFKADDNEPTINTEGSIDSVVSANANAGFSIVKYEGNGTSGATIGHNLSSAPEMIIVKNLSSSSAWAVFHTSIGATKYLALNETTAQQTATNVWNDTAPNSTTFTVGNWSPVNTSGNEHIAYCFHSVSGFSKISSYVGNGGSNSITGLGFQPDFVMIKSTGSGSWFLYDSERTVSVGDNAGTANARPYILANTSGAENGATSYNVDLDSNGFSINTSAGDLNTNGTTYIYMAFKIN